MKAGFRQQLLFEITAGKNLGHLRKSLVFILFHSVLELKIFEFAQNVSLVLEAGRLSLNFYFSVTLGSLASLSLSYLIHKNEHNKK